MKRILSSPLFLILAAFLLASSLLACPDVSVNPTGTDPSEGLSFIQTGTCGSGGSNNPTVVANDEFETSAWTVTNNNWGGGVIFTLDLGAKTLGDYSGFTCTIRRDSSGLAWKDIYLEHAPDGTFSSLDSDNVIIGKDNTGSTETVGSSLDITIPFMDLEAATAAFSGEIQLAFGVSAPAGTVYTIHDIILVERPAGAVYWVDAPSLKLAAADDFDYFGIAVNADELADPTIMDGLVVHADSVTIGNEFKPDYILGKELASTTTFIALDGNEYDVPASLNFTTVDASLELCRANGLEMRGHVLVWHSQSPDWFFREDFSKSAALVSSTVMNARLEWYIKSVLEHITEWENTNNAGERIITTWDVVNEAASDDSASGVWLRGSNGSTDTDWFAIYGDEEFIVNAFVYANRYAPAEVLLAYNDYNAAWDHKTAKIVRIIEAIQANPDARIDVLGMQSHVGLTWPGVNAHRTAIDAYLAKGVDVQITELDIGCPGNSEADQAALAALYQDYFELFIEKRATASSKGVTGVTIWGISDGDTWLPRPNYPLPFDAWFNTKPAFDAILATLQ